VQPLPPLLPPGRVATGGAEVVAATQLNADAEDRHSGGGERVAHRAHVEGLLEPGDLFSCRSQGAT